ncbi:MAG: hypothetical protein ABS873_03405, partial [Alkalibacterium sp.]
LNPWKFGFYNRVLYLNRLKEPQVRLQGTRGRVESAEPREVRFIELSALSEQTEGATGSAPRREHVK